MISVPEWPVNPADSDCASTALVNEWSDHALLADPTNERRADGRYLVRHYSGRPASATALLAGLLLVACDNGQPPAASEPVSEVSADAVAAGRIADTATAADLGDLRATLAALEHRRSLIEDANDIKRLQRSYGYYLDNMLWDQMVDLFADDATIEIGLDGVYVGRDRIRDYLYALGNGEQGLRPGQLNEHMQLMPVVTVAPDGMSAKARWRAVILGGTYGENAYWGEGPYENEYVKVDGVWRLDKVHWFQSVVVPYETGWQTAEDLNGGIWASEELPPDRPPSVEYETWPGTYLPPFHFPNPVLGAVAVDLGAYAPATHQGAPLPELATAAAELARSIALLEDENAIEQLQRIYGFYIDKGFWTQAANLFADDGTIEIGNSGVYVGRDRVLAYLETLGDEFPRDGRLFERMQLQPVVHVAPDGMTARARWRLFAQEAMHGEFSHWGAGVYENTYLKEGGVWKIQSLHGYPRMYTTYEEGWAEAAIPDPGPSSSLPPDRPSTVEYERYPAAFVPPFHYENPVTGAPVYTGAGADFATAPVTTAAALDAQLASLGQRIVRLEDFDTLERLNAIYGYYLARNEWDNLAGIFAPDGTIEIAMRGVYEGSASVRRNLNLYGEAGIHHGLLHNHMQYQPVITIADDGLSARMRSRAFSIMGQYEAYAMWMGGIYENVYVKTDGIWKIQSDHVINTYFVPYALGWKTAPPRPPPGITETNPPDSPPTIAFEMYPTAFLPPYHYPNPVTGERVTWPAVAREPSR